MSRSPLISLAGWLAAAVVVGAPIAEGATGAPATPLPPPPPPPPPTLPSGFRMSPNPSKAAVSSRGQEERSGSVGLEAPIIVTLQT